MDKKEQGADRWKWLPSAMPGVARLMAEKRHALGDQHINECWRRGMAGEPGWFFAREGQIAIGTPSHPDDWANYSPTQALLILRDVGA